MSRTDKAFFAAILIPFAAVLLNAVVNGRPKPEQPKPELYIVGSDRHNGVICYASPEYWSMSCVKVEKTK